jgi:hypothetical protein
MFNLSMSIPSTNTEGDDETEPETLEPDNKLSVKLTSD